MKAQVARFTKIIVGILISSFFVWLTLRGNVECSSDAVALAGKGCSFSKIELLKKSLMAADYIYLMPFLIILALIHFVRAFRWGILLEPLGKVNFRETNCASAVGFMALMLMPFRLGEFARPIFIAQSGKIKRSAAMATIAIERVVDGMAMAVVLILALLISTPKTSNPAEIQWVRMGGWIVFIVFFTLFLFLVIAYIKRELAVGLLHRLVCPFSEKLALRLSGIVDTFIGGLKMVPSFKKILLFLVLTAFYWGINGIGMAILARGFGLPLGIVAAFAVLGLLVAGVMIPAGPAMMGTFHGAIILGMKLFFPEPSQYGAVVAYAWVLWGAQLLQTCFFGFYFVLAGRITVGRFWNMFSQPDLEA
jgi:hypothetical protein